ncbi:serine hydrolase [Streptococcus oricebi]|uniref:D-alanyl-D-alanine carboxypeptidase n=1 Tax=Streptococcus oricebi TaxID=1547447 RepID=A0ABS5B3R8_9STRE|nr:serine hydrolase [Streptococcus oricebi]MBP2623316.1 D-alanyl-D-alanine carboxypeptidase [Streptococcus oricebi]
MKKYSPKTITILSLALLTFLGLVLWFSKVSFGQKKTLPSQSETSSSSSEPSPVSPQQEEIPPAPAKSMEAKQAVMEADAATMDAYGLHYDYANLSLPQVVQAYLAEMEIDPSCIAFSYKDLTTGQTASMNESQPMTAGSTYKLPLNMLVVDEVEAGKLSMTEKFDITNTYYEYIGEHNNYVGAFAGAMTIPDMQEYSLLYSENTPAYALAERLGGIDKAYSLYNRYGQSKGEVKTISQENKTTSDYYIQVLDYLWQHKDKYKDILYYIGESFPNEYYKRYLHDITIYQKPGYVREALNVDAIVMEEKPYIVALYTAGLGGSTLESNEISGVGINQVGELSYVINEWHRVNMN